VADDLFCVAVPVRQGEERVLAAISITQAGIPVHSVDMLVPRLSAAAAAIAQTAFGRA
jgi:DNA-binding IclR family transcriptional regulator